MNGDTPKSIVHPTDLSFASQDAFAHALRIAVACKSMLHILHIEAPETEEDDWRSLSAGARDAGALEDDLAHRDA